MSAPIAKSFVTRLVPGALAARQPSRPLSWLLAGGFVLLASTLAVLLIVRLFVIPPRTQHFMYLADAFDHGSFAVDNLPAWYQDKVVWANHVFVPLGPMPAVLLLPVAALAQTSIDEVWISIAITLLIVWLLDRVISKLGVLNARRRRWFVLWFVCGTIYLAVAIQGHSWFLSHVLTTLFLLLAIDEELSRSRAWLVGVWLGCAFLTRVTATFGVVFFLFMWWRRHQLSVSRLFTLAAGFAPSLLFFYAYNYARFGSVWETGYGHAIVGSPVLEQALSYGLFSPVHIPKNLYILLLSMPQPVPNINAPVLQFPYIQPSPWGMGILVTTPLFLYALRASGRDPRVVSAWLAVFAIGLPLMTYYGIGWIQFGYRYALDFYPFLMVPTVLAMNQFWSRWVPIGIVACLLINIWGAFVSL